jgi:hypothetical protein
MPSHDANRSRVARHRARLRAMGLRPVQIWVPDTRSPGFLAEAARQSRLVDADPQQFAATMEWVESVSVFDEPEASPEDDRAGGSAAR